MEHPGLPQTHQKSTLGTAALLWGLAVGPAWCLPVVQVLALLGKEWNQKPVLG